MLDCVVSTGLTIFHLVNADPSRSVTVESVIRAIAERFAGAELTYGHGTETPVDEAAYLVFAHLGLDHASAPGVYARPLAPDEAAGLETLAKRRAHPRGVSCQRSLVCRTVVFR